ncbi:MAG: type II secretion system protein [Gemmatimonadales bacterium]
MNRRGFTLIELLTTTAILGLLATIALPKYQQIRKRGNAAEIVAAMTAIRSGAFQYSESHNAWPPSTLSGVPTGLGEYLQGGGAQLFDGPYHQMSWLSTPSNSGPPQQMLMASINDGVICQTVYGLLGGTGNADLMGACTVSGGFVFLWVDR